MMTTQNLRSIASAERHSNTILRVDDLEIGVRLNREYLWQAIRALVDDSAEMREHLYRVGLASRSPEYGHGYVQIFHWGVAAPQTNWSARDRGKISQEWYEASRFSVRLRREVGQLLKNATLEHLRILALHMESAVNFARDTGHAKKVLGSLNEGAYLTEPFSVEFVEKVLSDCDREALDVL